MNKEKKYLNNITYSVQVFLKCIDKTMKKPSSVERGKEIGGLVNKLQLENDSAMHFGLDLSFIQINNRNDKIKI
jgi:hypothetical protein